MKQRKKSILFFVESFLPPAYLPRVRYFCEYFIQNGWDVSVIYEKPDYQEITDKNIKVLTIDYYKYKNGASSKIEWLSKFIINLIFDYKSHFFYRKCKKFIYKNQYDIVFSSTHLSFPITTAAKASKVLNIPLFVDLRDIPEQSPHDSYYLDNKPPKLFGNLITKLYKKINLKRRNKVLKKANGVTTVSPWHVKILSKYNQHTYLIYNGFDESKFYSEKINSEKFIISYFGRIYSEQMRNPRLLFEALEALKSKKRISDLDFRVRWHVDEQSKQVLINILNDYDIDNYIELRDFVKPDKLREEMNKSSILLIINTSTNYFGIMTTKLFESIGVNKPILCYPDNNDELSKLIKENNCGTITSDTDIIENFILENYNRWKKFGYIEGNLDEKKKMIFSRKKGGEVLENLFLDSIKN